MQNLENCVRKMTERGFDKAQARFSINARDEMQAEFNEASMLRTVENRTLELAGIVAGKRATASVNQHTDAEVDAAIETLWQSAMAAQADDANDIAEAQQQVVLGRRVVVAAPFPEILADVADVAPAGDVLERLVIDRQHGRSVRHRSGAEVHGTLAPRHKSGASCG